MANELRISLIIDEKGNVNLAKVKSDLDGVASAAKRSGSGLADSGKHAAAAGIDYGKLGSNVAMAEAKLIGMYAAVRGGASAFKNAMESIDYYQKAIIRMAASAADVAPAGTNLEKYYADQKAKYKDLIDYIQLASAKYFANAREIMTVTEWAIARGHTNLGKKEVDAIGQMIDKIKQLVPWIKQEGQVLQEINALWEGNTRVTDTFGKLVFDRLKATGQVTEEGKKAKEQYKDILEGWKDEGFSGFIQKVNELFKGSAIASKDIQMTWESTVETLGTLKDKLLLTSLKPVYEDVNRLLQGIVEKYLTGADAAKRQEEIAREVAAAWKMIKATAADVAPIIQTITRVMADAWGAVKGMPEGVQEVGIVAFFLVGSKGKAAIVAILAMLKRVETLVNSIKAVVSGGMSLGQFFGGDKGELDSVIDKMKEINRQKENFNQFKDMNTAPAKKAPFKLMGLEEEDLFGQPVEYFIQDTDMTSGEAYLERAKTLVDSIKAVVSGGMSLGQFFGGDKGELDSVIDKMKEINRQKEDLFGQPVEYFIQDTDMTSGEAYLERAKTLVDSIKAVVSGGMSLGQFFGGDKGELDSVIDKMKEINRQKENFNQFKDMNTAPAKKAPFKLMGLEEEDLFGQPVEYFIQDTDMTSGEAYRSSRDAYSSSMRRVDMIGREFANTATIGGGTKGQQEALQEQFAMLKELQQDTATAGKDWAQFWEAGWKRAGENVQDGISNVFYALLTDTKDGLDVMKSLFQGFSRIISELAADTMMNLAKMGMQSIGGGGGLSGILGGVASFFGLGGGGNGIGDLADKMIGGMSFKMGDGAILPNGFTPLARVGMYGDGAVFDQPTFGIIGERKRPEGVVPLDEYDISKKGAKGGGDVHIINVWDPAMVADIARQVLASQSGQQIVLNIVQGDLAERGLTRRMVRR